ncbi:DUF1835 domain-containing protein [Reichenbachiella sp.]|uniref:DUF1835 domain-containing protein n=1 Tax=Reichenbachiella sp. TaxID=2184521 RepID=UPI0032986DFA
MKDHFHILNGDALKSQFPTTISGTQIVARECLADGEVVGSTPDELYKTRERFISQNYEGYKDGDYFNKTVREFERIRTIPTGSEVCLWFEDDLFCQVNLWFVLHLLKNVNCRSFLVRPKTHTRFGFGGLNQEELVQCYRNKQKLSNLDRLNELWLYYQNGDSEALLAVAKMLNESYPFLTPAVQAYVDSIPHEGHLGRPIQTLIQIKKDLKTEEFSPIFKEFCVRESIYGFGDLQVKRLLKELTDH